MGLYERLLNELTYSGIVRKQQSVTRLFPTFYQRVRKVKDAGRVTLVAQSPDTWRFSVPSAGKAGSYVMYLRFKNIEEMLKKFVPNAKLWNNEKTDVDYNKLGPEVMNKVDMEFDCSCPADCLVANTKIPLLNGEILTIKELLDRYSLEKEFWVYSVNDKGNFIPGKAKHLGLRGKNSQLIKITLDNNKYFECTPDHRIMLRDGSYKKASELIINESLMPLYFKLSKKTQLNKESYLEVKLNKLEKNKNSWRKVHSIVNETVNKEQDLEELFKSVKEVKNNSIKICPCCNREFISEEKRHFHINNNRMKEKKLLYNHKIKNIEIINLEIPIEVYDIAVENTHNFLLECGNIVHNSYWGDEYIKTQRGAQYGRQEYRPPNIRNPKQYSIVCKHQQALLDKLPSYNFTFNGFLKKFYANEVKQIFDQAVKLIGGFKKVAAELGKKEEEELNKPTRFGRGGRVIEEPPIENEEEK